MRNDPERLRDILEAILQIQKYAGRGKKAFDGEELIRNWMVHHLFIIGEAARALTPEFRTHHPGVPWSKIIGMRHILVHDYFQIDADIVWSVIEKDLPDLKTRIGEILKAG